MFYKILLLLSSFLFVSSLHSQDIKKLDSDYGFRNFVFGTDIQKYKNMKFLSGDETNKYYACKDDTLVMGGFPLKEISYGFYKGKLYWISIKVNGYKNSRGVLHKLDSEYGEGRKFNEYTETRGWEGERVKMGYNENTFNKNAIINIWSQSIADSIKAETKGN